LMPRPLYPQGKAPGTQWIRALVGLRAGLDPVTKTEKPIPLPRIEPPVFQPVA